MPRKNPLPDRLTLFGACAVAHPDVDLHRDQAQGLAIVVNEFIVNSFEYAFTGTGVLTVTMAFDATSAVLEMSDDGPGKPRTLFPASGPVSPRRWRSSSSGRREKVRGCV